MTTGIYAWFCAETNECLYVGLAKNVESRAKGHLKALKYETHRRKDWIAWYLDHDKNPDSMVFTVLEECANDSSILNKMEMKWFNLHQPRFYGKEPSEKENWTHSEATREKIAETLRRKMGNFSGSSRPRKKIPRKTPEWTPIFSKEELESLYSESHKSLREIAKLYNTSHITVRNYLKEYEIPLRGHSPVAQLAE